MVVTVVRYAVCPPLDSSADHMAVGSTEQFLEEGRLDRAVAGEMREVAAGSGRGGLTLSGVCVGGWEGDST